jgi:hypothetical protein
VAPATSDAAVGDMAGSLPGLEASAPESTATMVPSTHGFNYHKQNLSESMDK